ncbi:hypothetical protein, partial [Ascidiaceihabitans sp.]|uniref:hypothetical protein n=1 Tax=Ascidiaceihabitans sp. TaxID=1872644 RepID=UPI003299AA90
GTPPSACFNTAIICASLYRTFFIVNLLRYLAEKILLLNNTNFRGDYPDPQIVSHLLARKPTCQRDTQRILPEFVRPFQYPLGIMLRITLPGGA